MNQNIRQAYHDQIAAQYREWSAKIEVVRAKVAKEMASARLDYYQVLDHWTSNEPVIKKKLEELRVASAEGFESIKDSAQSVWDEMKQLMKTIEEKTNEAHH